MALLPEDGAIPLIRTVSQFIDLVRPAINSNDIGIVGRVSAYVDLAILTGLDVGRSHGRSWKRFLKVT